MQLIYCGNRHVTCPVSHTPPIGFMSSPHSSHFTPSLHLLNFCPSPTPPPLTPTGHCCRPYKYFPKDYTLSCHGNKSFTCTTGSYCGATGVFMCWGRGREGRVGEGKGGEGREGEERGGEGEGGGGEGGGSVGDRSQIIVRSLPSGRGQVGGEAHA